MTWDDVDLGVEDEDDEDEEWLPVPYVETPSPDDELPHGMSRADLLGPPEPEPRPSVPPEPDPRGLDGGSGPPAG
ncbi:MAG: hypothetical protein NVSMB32_17730 [Actinomycetota bacterium]